MAQKGKIAIKKQVLGAKSGYLEVEKIRACKQTRKAKWYKMQVLCLKMDKTKGMKSQIW